MSVCLSVCLSISPASRPTDLALLNTPRGFVRRLVLWTWSSVHLSSSASESITILRLRAVQSKTLSQLTSALMMSTTTFQRQYHSPQVIVSSINFNEKHLRRNVEIADVTLHYTTTTFQQTEDFMSKFIPSQSRNLTHADGCLGFTAVFLCVLSVYLHDYLKHRCS